jgi:hypothetical protein
MNRFEINWCRHEQGWVVFENGDQITPGFSCEEAAEVWLKDHKRFEEQEIEEIILGVENG